MHLTKEQIRKVVIESLCAVGNDDDWSAISGKIRPIGDLGLKSVDGLDLCVELEYRLECKIDNKLNPLVNDERNRARSVDEIINWVGTHAVFNVQVASHE